jgi:hypothetical protein
LDPTSLRMVLVGSRKLPGKAEWSVLVVIVFVAHSLNARSTCKLISMRFIINEFVVTDTVQRPAAPIGRKSLGSPNASTLQVPPIWL